VPKLRKETMALRNWLRKLERDARKGHSSFVLKDGNVFRYDHNLAGLEMMVYTCGTNVRTPNLRRL
jgi:hypothetical protein